MLVIETLNEKLNAKHATEAEKVEEIYHLRIREGSALLSKSSRLQLFMEFFHPPGTKCRITKISKRSTSINFSKGK